MSLPNLYSVHPAKRVEIKSFIETHHYSKSINGIKSTYCFKLIDKDNKLIGAILYGSLATTAWKKYSKEESKVIELRRLVCIDDTPKNTESYFIGSTLRWLRKNTSMDVVVSYSDPYYGHEGIVYQASNFTYMGKTNGDKKFFDGKKYYHSRALRTKDSHGNYKPFVRKLRELYALGELEEVILPPKNIFIYPLRKRRVK